MSAHVYRCYSGDGALLYIGYTQGWPERARMHAYASRAWWPQVQDVTFEEYPDRRAALQAEREAIATEKPRWNVDRRGTDFSTWTAEDFDYAIAAVPAGAAHGQNRVRRLERQRARVLGEQSPVPA